MTFGYAVTSTLITADENTGSDFNYMLFPIQVGFEEKGFFFSTGNGKEIAAVFM